MLSNFERRHSCDPVKYQAALLFGPLIDIEVEIDLFCVAEGGSSLNEYGMREGNWVKGASTLSTPVN